MLAWQVRRSRVSHRISSIKSVIHSCKAKRIPGFEQPDYRLHPKLNVFAIQFCIEVNNLRTRQV